jgi:YD repeat-containing protein
MVSSPGFQEAYQYDTLGRPTATTTTIAGATLVTRRSYDTLSGALDTLTYPAASGMTPLRVRHHYDRGRLVRLSDADSAGTYWQLNAVDSADHRTDETLGNGVRIVSSHDAVSGHLRSRTAGLGGGSTLQNLGYAWDAVGNLTLREERNRGVQEQFFHDSRDRLDYVLRGGSVSLDLDYDDPGNLAYKSDVGQYRYDTIRKHAVVAAGANTYAYDASGAVVRASSLTPAAITRPSITGRIGRVTGRWRVRVGCSRRRCTLPAGSTSASPAAA